jgi:outer membrane receptor protein involved in Fe transport
VKKILFLIVFAAGLVKNVTAQKVIDSLPPVTITTDNNLQSKVLSKIVIQTRGINNSQELLTMVPGLFIGQHAGGGKAEQLFLRGFDIDHGTDVNISVDGVPVNMVSHAHGQGYADLHFVIPELVDNILFNKGPYYADKGDFATAGYAALNIKNILPVSMIKGEGGQFNTKRAVAAMNLLPERSRKNGKSLFIAGELMKTNGYFDNPQNFDRVNLFTRYQSKISLNSILNISASYFKSSWNASGQIPERAVNEGLISFYGAIDPDEGGETDRKSINAILSTNFHNGVQMKNQVYVASYNFDLFSNFTFFKNDSINGDQIRQREKRVLAGYNSSMFFTHFAGSVKLKTEAGIGLRSDFTKNSELSHTLHRSTLLTQVMKGDVTQFNSSAYVREDIIFSNRINITAGLRIDRFDFNYADALADISNRRNNNLVASPKLNLAYQLKQNVQLYVSTGKGFHSNDTRVSAYNNRRNVLPAVYGIDFGMIWKPVQNLYVHSAVWYLKVEDELVYVGDEGIVEPSGKTNRMGVDASARYQPINRLVIDVDANYSHARSEDGAKGESYLPLAPVFTSTGGMMYKSAFGLNAGMRYRLMGKRPANEDYSTTAKGYLICDALISYERPSYEVRLSASNIFNTRWKETQFDTESRLRNETFPVSEIHFTPGNPIFIKAGFTWFIKY